MKFQYLLLRHLHPGREVEFDRNAMIDISFNARHNKPAGQPAAQTSPTSK
jgi:hypothetical protein